MLNIYRGTFTARCPNNSKLISYNFELHLKRQVQVEEITAFCANFSVVPAYQETLANNLLKKFWGYQVIRAFHHGIEIETHRGSK